ncbi:MAG TPA: YfhO family protein [Thermoanaerobaculia bacterium]
MLLTLVMFVAASAATAAVWNRFFERVPWRIVALFVALAAVHQAETLFTDRVDLPANLAFHAYPWKATGAPAASANTGIVFTQLAPWTRIARDQVLAGDLPLWNRHSAGGAPLLANQQTAIFHPFTLLGLPLTVGKAFTLTAALRLFTVLFFTFVLLRGWGLRDSASIFGAVAYAFCTFHVVWLLFPLGLATMMLPVALAGASEVARTGSRAAYVLLTLGLALSVLGGHPESALWVWIATAAYVLYGRQRIVLAASAFVVAGLLTAFFWYPTLRALQTTERFEKFHRLDLNPADHGLSWEWQLPLVAANILGNPVDASYRPPRGTHLAVLNDYGEVASGYAGLLTLALALTAPFVSRRRPLFFALGLMLFALLSFAEVPLWRDAIRALPLAGVSLHQRLRVLWDLGACIAAAVAIDSRPSAARVLAGVCLAGFGAMYLLREPALTPLGLAQLAVPAATLIVFAIRPSAALATALVFADLSVATWRYNPAAKPEHVYPETGAIAFLRQAAPPARMAAWGWSFLPETPGWYGLEDVKTTDPVQHFSYMFLLRGYLDVDPASPDLVLRNVERGYLDFLNVRWLYVPPGHAFVPRGFVERYRGADGAVLENTEALPRYFFVREAAVEPDLGAAIAKSRFLADYRAQTIVDRKPAGVPSQYAGGAVTLVRYEANRTLLDVDSRGWNLLVTSDTFWPGWKARIDGRPHELVKVFGTFAGLYVPPGKARVELYYWPDELTQGLVAGGVGLLLLGFVLLRLHSTKRSSRINSSKWSFPIRDQTL